MLKGYTWLVIFSIYKPHSSSTLFYNQLIHLISQNSTFFISYQLCRIMYDNIIVDLLKPHTSLLSWELSSSSSSSNEELFRRQIELLHEYNKIMIKMGKTEEKEQDATSSRRRRGSKRGRIDKQKSHEHKLGEVSLNRDCFGDNPRFKGISFRRRFCMSEGVYQRI
ncbi:hypothetical protein GIB67_038514 [Kingdonia uniflora]|uniref:Uncharacterized protein n=1 Tax=Kingdonia uniflora TaxID=39325 RepID=A0A7J7NP77_9MAGN|nr:hypothetical protein GIB67_038514 [Kingdonia uniflora]